MSVRPRAGERRLPASVWALLLVGAIVALSSLSLAMYVGVFKKSVPVILSADRTGLAMETDSKVMLNGVQVGRVVGYERGVDPVRIKLSIDSAQAKFIPANVAAQIRATTIFGAKYVDLIYPPNPTKQRLSAGSVLKSKNVTTEINTVLESLQSLVDQIDPMKLNAVLATFSQGVRGKGEQIGQSITDANQVLLALNPRNETVRRDWQGLKGFSDVYGAAAGNVISVLDAAATTSTTITGRSGALDALLVNTIGLSQAGIDLLAPNQQNLTDAINKAEPTTALLMKYSPTITCELVGVKLWLDRFAYHELGGNGYSQIQDLSLSLGDEPYKYPDNLPIVAAKGGPGGRPSCGSLPDVSKMYPVRQLITNTGWGTGVDIRPNPGIASDCYRDYLPVTRGIPQPPSLRHCLWPAPGVTGPAPGPVNLPGMPPYGAPMYGPGGESLWPALPDAQTAPPVPVPDTPVAPGKIPPDQAPATFSAPPPPVVLPDPGLNLVPKP